jgi:hypothetical protein
LEFCKDDDDNDDGETLSEQNASNEPTLSLADEDDEFNDNELDDDDDDANEVEDGNNDAD